MRTNQVGKNLDEKLTEVYVFSIYLGHKSTK